LQLHYYLPSSSHAMNATVRNKCEAEALAIFDEIASVMGIKITVESVAYSEGGLVELWAFMGSSGQLTLISSIIMPLIVGALFRPPKPDPELERLTKEDARLGIEEKRLRIEKLKKESQAGEVPTDAIEELSYLIDRNQKVAVRKSNFYKILTRYKRVTGIGLTTLNSNSVPTDSEKYIARQDFRKFVLLTDKLPIQVIEDAKIEIISPVLKEGDYQWKGIYEGTTISFSMLDGDFRNSVLRGGVSFRHGTVIECVINILSKFNEIGDITPTHYSVDTVIKKTEGAETLETIQGKRYLAGKKFRDDQMGLWMGDAG
jgi:hypothetical protein